jgi:hypothetical protein
MLEGYQACLIAPARRSEESPQRRDAQRSAMLGIVYKGLTRRAALWCYPPDLSDRLAFPLFMFAGSL